MYVLILSCHTTPDAKDILQSRQPSVAIKLEENVVPRTYKKALEKLNTDWNSLAKWPTLELDSDVEEILVPPRKAPERDDGKISKPILDPETSFVVRVSCHNESHLLK